MNRNYLRKILMGIAVVAMVGFGVNALAGWGMGYGRHEMGPEGPGWHHRGMGGPGSGYMGRNLNEDEMKKFDEARQSFFEETESLRQSLYVKELELRSEFAKEKPDAKKASEIQKEISGLEAQLSQKRIDHMIKMREINPGVGRGFMGRGPKGYGNRGNCWQ